MYKGQDSHVLYNNTTHQQFYSHVKEHSHDHIFPLRGEIFKLQSNNCRNRAKIDTPNTHINVPSIGRTVSSHKNIKKETKN
jgi:hypothetical protein